MRNQYPGVCYRCGEMVPANEGHFEKITSRKRTSFCPKWRTQHTDCAIIWRGQPDPTKEEARAARRALAQPSDGEVSGE